VRPLPGSEYETKAPPPPAADVDQPAPEAVTQPLAGPDAASPEPDVNARTETPSNTD